jgi:hypothetical protein
MEAGMPDDARDKNAHDFAITFLLPVRRPRPAKKKTSAPGRRARPRSRRRRANKASKPGATADPEPDGSRVTDSDVFMPVRYESPAVDDEAARRDLVEYLIGLLDVGTSN